MADSPLPLPSIARQLQGEEQNLAQLLYQLGDAADAHPEVWRALVDRAVLCLKWAQQAILAVAAHEGGPEPAPAMPTELAQDLAKTIGGLSSVVPVFSALQLFVSLAKSGSLRVECSEGEFEVMLENGVVVYAQGTRPAAGERLGEILVALGTVTQPELDAALERAQAERAHIGTLLIRDGLVSQEELSNALGEQAWMIFSRMHASGDARWRFEEHDPATVPANGRVPAGDMLRDLSSTEAGAEAQA